MSSLKEMDFKVVIENTPMVPHHRLKCPVQSYVRCVVLIIRIRQLKLGEQYCSKGQLADTVLI